jgi:hypothetical protein
VVVTVSTYRGPVSEVATLGTSGTIELTAGPFAGGVANVTASPLGAAVLAAFADGLLLRVTAPSADDAIAVANSVRPVD